MKDQQQKSSQQSTQKQTRNNKSKYWHLYGKTYDLTSFLYQHPGGPSILLSTKCKDDITPMFESYHALADFEKIRQKLQQFEVKPETSDDQISQYYSFDKNDFYCTVRERVRAMFGVTADKKSVTSNIKANPFFIIKTMIQILIVVMLYSTTFFAPTKWFPTWVRCIVAIAAGNQIISLAFCIMHDASHFALTNKNQLVNKVVNKISQAMIFFDSILWQHHHCYRHHTYTQDPDRDPDVIYAKPLLRFSPFAKKNDYLNIKPKFLTLFSIIWLWFFPGQLLGQIVVYHFVWKKRGYLWKMSLPEKEKNYGKWESYLALAFLLPHIYQWNLLISYCYLIGANITYSICIIPDHDTFETLKNHSDTAKDWGEIQVRNSSNWSNKKWFDVFCHLYGGINYQIEHHLFPSVCHVHLPKIQPIVAQTCKEFNIPYVNHESVFTAYKDFWRLIERVASNNISGYFGQDASPPLCQNKKNNKNYDDSSPVNNTQTTDESPLDLDKVKKQ